MPPRWACCLSLVVLAACNQGATPVEKPRTPEQEVSQARGLPPGQEVPAAYDWPQWQGPDRTAVSRETRLLKHWPKEGPPLLWKATRLGGSYTTPSVAAGRIFGISFRGSNEVVWALEEAGGKEVWR